MDQQAATEILVGKIKDYAASKSKDVARGAETSRLAGLLVQKYGKGMIDAVAVIFDSARATDPIYKIVDEETFKIDPMWRENAKVRQAGRPADITTNTYLSMAKI